ncbi:hypothetical protein DF268_46075 [Streptomyces sp. V2]|nr:hypothetical protein DF268_46075 [Streptomyces sp. V2]
MPKKNSNVVPDAASGVSDIFHGIDKPLSHTLTHFCKAGHADTLSSSFARK